MILRRLSTSAWLVALAVIALLVAFALTGGEPRSRGLLLNTLILIAATLACSLPVGTVLALLLTRCDLPGRTFFAVVLGALLFLPLVVQTAAWMAGFGLQGWFTMIYGGGPWLEHWSGAIWVHSVAAIPWVTLIVGVSLRVVEPEIEEAALLDASQTEVFLRITAPRALGGVATAGLLVAVMIAGEITVTDVFLVRTYAEELFTQLAAQDDSDSVPLGLLPGVVLVTSLVLLATAAGSQLVPSTTPSTAKLRTLELRQWRVPAVILVAGLMLLLVGVPIANLMYKAGVMVVQVGDERHRSWSAGKFLQITLDGPWRYRRELAESLWIASLAATFATWVAVELTWKAIRGRVNMWLVLVPMAVAFAIPGPVLGMAIIWLLNRPGVPPLVFLYDHTVVPPLLAQLIRALPVATFVMWHALRSVPTATMEAAEAEGAPDGVLLWKIVIPQRLAALAATWLVSFAVALAELPGSFLTVPPDVMTLPLRVFNLIHYGVEDYVAGILLGLLVVYAALSVLVLRLLRHVE